VLLRNSNVKSLYYRGQKTGYLPEVPTDSWRHQLHRQSHSWCWAATRRIMHGCKQVQLWIWASSLPVAAC